MADEREHPALNILRGQIDRIRLEIEELFNYLKHILETKLESIYNKFRDEIINREVELKQLNEALLENQIKLKENALGPTLQRITLELEHQISEKEKSRHKIPIPILRCHCALEEFCSIEEFTYNSDKLPKWSWGGELSLKNKLSYPHDLALDDRTEEIFVVDKVNNRIQVCSFRGEYLRTIGDENLDNPLRITLSSQSVYVSQRHNSFLYRFNRITSQCVQQMRTEYSPSDLTCHNDLSLYVCDYNTQIIHVYNLDVTNCNIIVLETPFFSDQTQSEISHTESIQVTGGGIWVLFSDSAYPLQHFSFDGTLLKTVISEEKIERAFYFCLDPIGNILVSDYDANRVKVFSSEGELITNIGRDGQVGNGEICHPQGIGVTRKFNIVVVDWKQIHPLQFF